MKTNELREKTTAELEQLVREEQEELRGLRFKVRSEELKNVRSIRKLRRSIARLQTLLREKGPRS